MTRSQIQYFFSNKLKRECKLIKMQSTHCYFKHLAFKHDPVKFIKLKIFLTGSKTEQFVG